MKKLMCAAAALVAGVAVADITSANIVGYMQNPISGYKMATPTFGKIGAATYPINEYVIKGASDALTVAQIIGMDGQVDGKYYWYNEFIEGSTVYPAGWFDVLGVTPAEAELNAGDAVFFFAQEDNVKAESAGEVMGEVTVPLAGYKMVGNCSPLTININQLTVQGASDAQTIIQVLDSEGQSVGKYYWYNDGGPGYPAGWFDILGITSADISLNPGDAVFFFTQESGVTATIPAAIND